MTATATTPTRADGGLRGDRARPSIAAGCRFFAGYPMTPFTEVLEHFAKPLPEVGGVCINAESELEAVGMAWGALATGARAATGSTGQGLSLMQESFSRDHARRAAARHLQHGARPAGLLPGDPRRRPRRLPPHRARAAWTSREASSTCSSRSTSPTSGATRCSSTATTSSRTPRRRSTIEPIDVPRAARRRTGRVDGTHDRHRRRAAASRRSASARPASPRWASEGNGAVHRRRSIAARWQREVRVETGFVDDAETVVVAFGSPAQVREVRVTQLRAAGHRIGYVRPITLWPFPYDAVADAAAGRTCARVGVLRALRRAR